jgi:hypothetical protein
VITENGDRYFFRFTECATGEHAKHFVLALCEELDGDPIVVSNGTPYFRAPAVTDFADRDDLISSGFLRIRPKPIEEQLNAAIDTAPD